MNSLRNSRWAMMFFMAAAGSTVFSSCGLSDIKDSLVEGSLAGVKGAATNWVDGFILDLNELIDPFPDAPLVDTP
jgi:hypothetical protein